MGKRWPPEEEKFLRENIDGNTYGDIANSLNALFGENYSASAVGCKAYSLGLRNGRITLSKDRTPWSPEEVQFLHDNVKGISFEELAKRHNAVFEAQRTPFACQNKCAKLGLTNGVVRRAKQGDISLRSLPIGSLSKDQHGDVWIKVNNEYVGTAGAHYVRLKKNYKRLDRLNWEKEHPPLKKGEWLTHLDGNKENCDPSNLRVMNKRIFGGLTLDHMIQIKDPELLNCAIDYEELKFAVRDKREE